MRTAGTIDMVATGSSDNWTSGLSTPTHRTQVWVTLWGADSVDGAASLVLPVHPSGQHILSTLTRSVKAASVNAATIRSTLASIAPVGRAEAADGVSSRGRRTLRHHQFVPADSCANEGCRSANASPDSYA